MSGYAITIGTAGWRVCESGNELPGEIYQDNKPLDNGIWDADSIREKNATELLQDARDEKIIELEIEGLRRCNLVYGDTVFSSVGAIKLLIDIDDTYTRSGAPAARLITVNQVLTAFELARDAVNLLDQTGVAAYDVVTDPAWP